MTPPIEVGLIYGSTRPGRFCDTVAGWSARQIAAHGGVAAFDIDPARHDEAEIGRLLTRAEAFIAVVPEYNHGYPAPLKSLIDSAKSAWHAKPVAFVSYGGMSGRLRAVEQLRLVFAELHAVTLRDGVSFHMAWERFDEAGETKEAGAGAAASVMLDRLVWWASALKDARATRPYDRLLAAA